MRVVLTTLGTAGDFEPLLALAIEMQSRGHEPILASSPDFANRAFLHGIPFASIGPSIGELRLRSVLANSLVLSRPLDQARNMLEAVVPFVPRMVEELERICDSADVLVCLPYQLAGFMVHERTGVPYVAWNFSPFGALPSVQAQETTAEMINQCRALVGLQATSDPFSQATLSSRLALFAVSPHVFPRPARWPAHYRLTGYFFMDEDWSPYPELGEFLSNGPAPVIITFGSMTHTDPEGMMRLLLDAVAMGRCRAVIQSGWSGLSANTLPKHVHLAKNFIPHNWLFKQASCVVHHGAAGTSAAALKAAVPSVIVPHTLDQPLWAELIRGLGGSHATIPVRRLTSEALGRGIEQTLTSRNWGSLKTLAAKIDAESGVSDAAALIEQLVRSHETTQ